MKRVFCIGNGESRKGVNFDTLKPYGKIYGCNMHIVLFHQP